MNNIHSPHNVAAVILAAGKGKRMNIHDKNKVISLLHDRPIIVHIVNFMKKLAISNVVVVVGHAKESVKEVLTGEDILYAEQREQLGTGDALKCALEVLPSNVSDVYVVYGDDGVFYNDKHLPIVEQLLQKHFISGAAVTFLTIEQENPYALGRILRDEKGEFKAIIEEKDASDEQRKITEINPGCFLFNVAFLREHLHEIEKSPVTGEYYINSIIDLALRFNQKVETVRGGQLIWRGVNTPEELLEAEKLFSQLT